MTVIVSHVEDFRGTAGAVPDRAARATVRPRWLRIVGLTLLATIGLALGLIVGVLIVLSTGLVELC